MNELGRSIVILAAASVAIATPRAFCNDFAIESFSRNGEITWTDTNTNGHYRVEWSPSLISSNWLADWSHLAQIPATGGVITVEVPMFYRVVHRPQSSQVGSLQLRLVAAGGQLGGPAYDFYMSKFETTAAEYIAFLNDAQSNPTNARGSNMWFAANGDVYMDSSMSPPEIIFDVSLATVIYDSNQPIGSRYSWFPGMEDHPATGVSWYGAMKYCNWLTIVLGRGTDNLCYSEGTDTSMWIPAHLSIAQWQDGFDNSERIQWVNNFDGFRLPMTIGTAVDYFNEFLKSSAWNGTANTTYAFGRNSISGQDANYTGSGDPFEGLSSPTTPVGFYDGLSHGGFQTATNGNQYGIYDLSGNVAEWCADGQARGGAFNSPDSGLRCASDGASSSLSVRGFRVVTTSP